MVREIVKYYPRILLMSEKELDKALRAMLDKMNGNGAQVMNYIIKERKITINEKHDKNVE